MPIEYERLQCPACQGELFTPVFYVKHKPGSGIIDDKAGWACVGCKAMVNLPGMLREAELRKKREELRLLEAELGEPHAASRG